MLDEYQKAREDYIKSLKIENNRIVALQNLIELEIVLGNQGGEEKYIEKLGSVSENEDDRLLYYYLKAIIEKLQNQDTTNTEEEFKRLLKEDTELDWDTDDIETWLNNPKTDITPVQKQYIQSLTDKLKMKK